MGIELKIAGEEDSVLWDKIVESSPQGTLFHTWKCLKIIEKHSKTKLYPLIVLRGVEPIGSIPFFYQKKLGMKLLFCPPPHVALPRLGPLIVDYDKLKLSKKETTLKDFQNKIDEFIFNEIKPDFVTLTSGNLGDFRPYQWGGYSVEPTYNYIFNLDNELDKIWSNIKKNTKQDIERSRKRDYKVREGTKEDMEFIYGLLLERYSQQNRKVNVPLDYLLEMFDSFHPNNLRVFVVENNGKIITGSIEVYYNDSVITWIGNSKSDSHATDLLTWECLKWAHDYGYKKYIIMGAAGVERLHSFYSKFNPDLIVSFSAKKYKSSYSKFIFEYALKNEYIKKLSKMI